ncbi:MAG TPA: sulfite exporter TauE/SafE family protein [Polyangia bacterium]|nr:sulfite exporter TauE/SafE family protein [Polyangia bacterium]
MSAKAALFVLLVVFSVVFGVRWYIAERKAPGTLSPAEGRVWKPTWAHVLIGFLTNFFDYLGIGSFASTTSVFKFTKTVDDENIPGTLNVGHTFPTLAEALISIALVTVDMTTLVSMIAAAVAGAYLGAGLVARWPKRRIQMGMGILLVVAATIIAVRQLALVPGGEAIGVGGTKLAIAVMGNFVLGALMTLGIGLFAPCMILISLLGMDPKTAFPIMMGSCAFLMPVASWRFVRSGRYDRRASLGLALGGVPAVLIAAYLVKSLPLYAVKWLIVVVVIYTAVAMIRSAVGAANQKKAPA